MKRPDTGEEGVVMLLVLVIIVLSISSVGTFARSSALEVMGMRNRADRGRAQLLARSGVAVALRALKDDLQRAGDITGGNLETARDPWYLLGEREVELPDHGRLRIRVRDMGSKINLNGLVDDKQVAHPLSRAFLVAALAHVVEKMPGRKEDRFYNIPTLADAILDWLDADRSTHLQEPETDAYKRAGALTVPSNRPFYSLNELADLPGVDAALLGAMRHYFTVHPTFVELHESGLNPNTAPGWALGLIYIGTPERRHLIPGREVIATLHERNLGRIFCPVDEDEPCRNFLEVTSSVGETAFPPLAYFNRAFEIRSVGHYREAMACVSTVVERFGLEDVRPIAYEQRCH